MIAFLLAWALAADLDLVKQLTGVTPDQWAKTDQLATGPGTIVAFTRGSDGDLDLNVFRRSAGDAYARTTTLACAGEGGPCTLRAFFFWNGQIGVLYGWDARHAADDFDDACPLSDEVRFFGVSKKGELEARPEDKRFYVEAKRPPKTRVCRYPRFKNVADVKRLLVR